MTLGKAGIAGMVRIRRSPAVLPLHERPISLVTDGHGKNDRVVKFFKGRSVHQDVGNTEQGREFDHPTTFLGGLKAVLCCRPSKAGPDLRSAMALHPPLEPLAASAVFVAKTTLLRSDSQSIRQSSRLSRGITVGSAKDGSLRAFIPDPDWARRT